VRQAEDIATEIDAGPITGGSETVLVVEDDDDVRGTVVELLSDLGYRVLRARDAQSALVIVESGVAVDLLFTDVVMPGPLRSPELARKARERLPDIAVLFTSGYTDNAIVHGGRLDEGIELLSKPYTREALARKLRHVLRNQQQKSLAAGKVDSVFPPRQGPADPPAVSSDPGLQVLLVEDEGLIRSTTAELLAELGHTVFQAENAADALDILLAEAIDVLLTDVGLPGQSGFHLAAEARQRNRELKVVFATGRDALPSGGEEAGLSGAILLPKPYDAAALVSALKAAAGQQDAASARDPR
jgi:CheY-like chemotaxis protein